MWKVLLHPVEGKHLQCQPIRDDCWHPHDSRRNIIAGHRTSSSGDCLVQFFTGFIFPARLWSGHTHCLLPRLLRLTHLQQVSPGNLCSLHHLPRVWRNHSRSVGVFPGEFSYLDIHCSGPAHFLPPSLSTMRLFTLLPLFLTFHLQYLISVYYFRASDIYFKFLKTYVVLN